MAPGTRKRRSTSETDTVIERKNEIAESRNDVDSLNTQMETSSVAKEELRKVQLRYFAGGSNVEEKAMEWVDHLEHYFSCSELIERKPISDTDKIGLACLNLRGRTVLWWRRIKADVHTWDEFKQIFHKTFVLERFNCNKRNEFRDICQGDLSVQEYYLAFLDLIRYDISPPESYLVHKFIMGLNDNHPRGQLLSIGPKSIEDVMRRLF